MNKKNITITIIILVIIAAMIIAYFLIRGTPSQETNQTTGSLPATPTQTINNSAAVANQNQANNPAGTLNTQSFGVVAQNQAMSFFVDQQNNTILVQPDGQIAKVTKGQASVLSSSAIANLARAEFSYDGKKILAVFGVEQNRQYSVFDIDSKSWNPVSLKMESPAWSPADYRIVYLTDKGSGKSLSVFDAGKQKSAPQELFRLHAEDLSLDWINSKTIILSEKGSVFYPSSAWSFDIAAKKLSPIVSGQIGLNGKWDGKTNIGLVFRADPLKRGGSLSLLNLSGDPINSFSFLSLPSKCMFSTERAAGASSTTAATSNKNAKTAQTREEHFVYCAIPRNQSGLKSARLPDDYEKKAYFTSDNMYKISLDTGVIESVFTDPSQTIDAEKLFASNNVLFFINRLDQKIYAVPLKK